jgi:hypothetical protein
MSKASNDTENWCFTEFLSSNVKLLSNKNSENPYIQLKIGALGLTLFTGHEGP